MLICSDDAVTKAVRSAIDSGTSLLVLDHLPSDARSETYQPSAVLIDSDVRTGVQTAFGKIEAAKRRYPSTPVVVLGNEMSAQLVLAALRAGADEFVDREADTPQIALAIRGCLDRTADIPFASRAKIAGVLSALPNDSDQDFAVNLAVRAAKLSPNGMTLYIDLSVPATQSAIALGVEPVFGISDAIREVARIDRALLESALARDPHSGLYVIPLCADFGSDVSPLEPGSFAALLQILCGCCETIIINYGPFSRQRPLLEMIRPTARFFLCCNQRFPSIRGASDLLRWLSENGLGTPEIVVHALASGRTPTAADIRSVLKVAQSIDLDATWEELAESVNTAKPIALSETRYSRGLDACLAQMGIAPEPEPDFLTQMRRWLSPQAVLRAQ